MQFRSRHDVCIQARAVGLAAVWLTGWVAPSTLRAQDAATEDAATETPAAAAISGTAYATQIKPFVAQYCLECHNNAKHKADLNFESFGDTTELMHDRKIWERVAEMLNEREMPPDNKPQPPQELRDRIVVLVRDELAKFDCAGPVNPGRVTLRRLNRDEYNNSIRDLLNVDFKPAADFPSDDVGYGFDNIGDVLSLPPLLMEKYLTAAEQIALKAIVTDYPPAPPRYVIKGATFKPQGEDADAIRPDRGESMGLYREGEATTTFSFPRPGKYRIEIQAYGDQAGPEPPRMAVRLDGADLETHAVPGVDSKPNRFKMELELEAGKRTLGVAYLNNYVVANHPDPKLRGDRNLFVEWLAIEGPLDWRPPPLPESHKRVVRCDPLHDHSRDCARDSLRHVAGRAWRRPVTDEELDRLLGFIELAKQHKGGFLEGMQVALQAILTSPKFLFRWELDPELDQPAAVRPLNDYELASRLSYFLWSSLPDDRLFLLAKRGELRRDDVLQAEVERMLKDSKARALVKNFGGQWLQIRNLAVVSPDPELFPMFDDRLRADMATETELFFEAIMKEDRSVLDFIDTDFTFLNERMASLYGIPGVEGDEFQRVKLDKSSARGGILTQASVLTITSSPTRTLPVSRGKYILEQILGSPPPPPPPDVPELEEDSDGVASASLRQRLEMHRAKAECATCHNKMDPLGFALENFDAVGRWRDTDGHFVIDPSGVLPTGEEIQGPAELKAILKTRDAFVRTITEKMLTFALGRGLEYYDKCAVDDVCTALAGNDFRFSSLVSGIVRSEPFRKKNVGSGPQTAALDPEPRGAAGGIESK